MYFAFLIAHMNFFAFPVFPGAGDVFLYSTDGFVIQWISPTQLINFLSNGQLSAGWKCVVQSTDTVTWWIAVRVR